ncbi:hypothetical protein [Micromonospora sp. 067-2]|uniref:hypothetical protein n=1 Tax=Micromonospora sp. 067-2 TaxID=2789270 RepID=UPI00397B8773
MDELKRTTSAEPTLAASEATDKINADDQRLIDGWTPPGTDEDAYSPPDQLGTVRPPLCPLGSLNHGRLPPGLRQETAQQLALPNR